MTDNFADDAGVIPEDPSGAELAELSSRVDGAVEAVATMAAAVAELQREMHETATAANHWFVRMRDELFARIEDIARSSAEPPSATASSGTSVFAPPGLEPVRALSVEDLREEMKAMVTAVLELQRDVRELLRQTKSAERSPPARRPGGSPGASRRRGSKPTYDELIRMLVTGDFET